MRKKKGILIFLLAVFLGILPITITTYASNSIIGMQPLEETVNFEEGQLLFTDIGFRYYEDRVTPTLGLCGNVQNREDSEVEFQITAYYYNSDWETIAQAYTTQTIPGQGSYDFSEWDWTETESTDKVDNIEFYSLLLEVMEPLSEESISVKPSENSSYDNYDYVIDKYHVDITVNEDNTFRITENITAYFNVSKHGIYRTIPLSNTVTRLDGTTSKNRAKVSEVFVNHDYTTSTENGNYKIKIGSESVTLTGEQQYEISYTYNIGKDTLKDGDELYYNIIGTEWDTVIGDITFTIIMPKEFEAETLGFSAGEKGSTDSSNITYQVNENVIEGSYQEILQEGEGLTIRMELPEGYFIYNDSTNKILVCLMYGIPVICLILSILLWYKYGKNDPIVETMECYPPEGYNSLQIGFLYHGKATNKDVVSLLIYLANKGYIKISETEKQVLLFKRKGFKIKKIRDYDGMEHNEQLFLAGLFQPKIRSSYIKFGGNHHSDDEVTSEDLKDNFYTTMNLILSDVNRKENRNRIFERFTFLKTLGIFFMLFISIIVIIGIPMLGYTNIQEIGILVFTALFFVPFCVVLFQKNQSIIFKIIWGTAFICIGGPFLLVFLPIKEALMYQKIYLPAFVTGIICVIGMGVCMAHMKKRTPYGNKMAGRIQGFKKFLETAKKEELETMIMQNPQYFYDMLPYAYVLDIFEKWIKKFEGISVEPPSWHDSSMMFYMSSFGEFMDNIMSSAQSCMSYSTSDSGDSGGGSSGGGSGGGGGGSW